MFRSPGGASHLVFLGQQKPSETPTKMAYPHFIYGIMVDYGGYVRII
jgi:hypothetical protein